MNSLYLVLSDDSLFAYRKGWRRETVLIGDVLIDGDLRGFLENTFRSYRRYSCKLIIDRSDEEFVLDTLPVVRSSMGKKAIAVKCARYFSEDAFTVGMDVGGIADKESHRVLYAGIENKNSLQKFMQIMNQLGIVFEAIYSFAILLAALSKQPRFQSNTLLVLSSQTGKAWRYSLVKSGRLLMSRCVFISGVDDLWEEVVEELKSTRAYADRIIDENQSMTCVYAGPKTEHKSSLAEKFIAGLNRRYRLFDSDDLYKEVIFRSYFHSWRFDVYTSAHSKLAYRRYFWANASIVVSSFILLASAVSVYTANQHNQDKLQKILLLQNSAIEFKSEKHGSLANSKVSSLELVGLRQLVEVFSVIDFNSQARLLEYRLASVLNRNHSIDLLAISFGRENDEGEAATDPPVFGDRNTVLTATFIARRGDKSIADQIVGFYSAIEAENLQILEKSNIDTPITSKGRLGLFSMRQKLDTEEFVVSVTLKAET